MYTYRSNVGTFEIGEGESGRWELRIDGKVLRTFDTARQAADAVYCRETGHCGWDSTAIGFKPAVLSDWAKT